MKYFAPLPRFLGRIALAALLAGLAACAHLDVKDAPKQLLPAITAATTESATSRSQSATASSASKPASPASRALDLLPPAAPPMPALPTRPKELRFDISVAEASPHQVLPAIVQGTPYSMVVHPDVKGLVTLRLKDTTVPEALDVVREMYGWEWRLEGNRIFVTAGGLQVRVFRVNYPTSSRTGRTEVRVSSGSIANPSPSPGVPGGLPGGLPTAMPGAIPGSPGGASTPQESTRVTTNHRNDLWPEVEATLKLLVGERDGRQVVVAPQSGMIVVRAMPVEMRTVEHYLREMRLNIERQVMIEAKIVEVSLRDQFQSGVNWAAFRPGSGEGSTRISGGVVAPGAILSPNGALAAPPLTATPGSTLALGATASSGLFGLAFQTGNFAAMLTFLETQGQIQVLSSPRIATLNNQKAVLKVGTDDFFVTNVSTTTVSSGTGNTTSPTITVQPFFSGIALDVTPQIDDGGDIILHVHPQVSQVEERQKQLNLGSLGSFTLPLASSSVRETDAVVRVPDGSIVAIGGLMREDASSGRNQVPGADGLGVFGRLLGQRNAQSSKQELVILIKPTVIHSSADWETDRERSAQRVRETIRP